MPQISGQRKIMSQKFDGLKVDAVYDLAAEIGIEFEKLIDAHGTETVSNLINKIIKALEHLENQIIAKDQLENKVSEMRIRIAQLESEKDERAECHQKFERELEQIEEQWRRESANLTQQVTHLEEENRRLKEKLHPSSWSHHSSLASPESCDRCSLQEDTNALVHNMKLSMEKLQIQLSNRDQELRHASENLELTQSQLNQMNVVLRDQVKQLQKQVSNLMEEKSFLQVQLASMLALDKWLAQPQGLQVTPCPTDLLLTPPPSPLVMGRSDSLVNTWAENKGNAIEFKEETVPLSEYKKLAWERDELICQLQDVKDELSSFKSSTSLHPSDPNVSLSSVSSCTSTATTSSSIDLPVEGPINREPYEKLYPGQRKPSGIRKFFRFLLGKDSDYTSSPL